MEIQKNGYKLCASNEYKELDSPIITFIHTSLIGYLI